MPYHLDLLSPSLLGAGSQPLPTGRSPQALKEACQEFEAILAGYLVRSMRATVPDDGALPRSTARRLFEEMLDDQLAREVAATGDLGLAKTMLRQLAPPGADQTPS
jgi:flagellar protein FlgJ